MCTLRSDRQQWRVATRPGLQLLQCSCCVRRYACCMDRSSTMPENYMNMFACQLHAAVCPHFTPCMLHDSACASLRPSRLPESCLQMSDAGCAVCRMQLVCQLSPHASCLAVPEGMLCSRACCRVLHVHSCCRTAGPPCYWQPRVNPPDSPSLAAQTAPRCGWCCCCCILRWLGCGTRRLDSCCGCGGAAQWLTHGERGTDSGFIGDVVLYCPKGEAEDHCCCAVPPWQAEHGLTGRVASSVVAIYHCVT
jgi:hypothetical protein